MSPIFWCSPWREHVFLPLWLPTCNPTHLLFRVYAPRTMQIRLSIMCFGTAEQIVSTLCEGVERLVGSSNEVSDRGILRDGGHCRCRRCSWYGLKNTLKANDWLTQIRRSCLDTSQPSCVPRNTFICVSNEASPPRVLRDRCSVG